MDLTRRQRTTLTKLLEIYQEIKEPLHYSVLADRLGVSKFTAYDMLRLLEEKGYVVSSFRLERDHSGPGRSEVVYIPTEKARQDFSDLLQKSNLNNQNWGGTVDGILAKISTGDLPEADFFNDILARIPGEENDRLRYCLEVMLVIALRMQGSPHGRLMQAYLPIILPNMQPACLEDLSLMGGVTLAILTIENENDPEWCQQLFEHIRRYKTLLSEMTVEEHQKLGGMISEIYNRFQQDLRP